MVAVASIETWFHSAGETSSELLNPPSQGDDLVAPPAVLSLDLAEVESGLDAPFDRHLDVHQSNVELVPTRAERVDRLVPIVHRVADMPALRYQPDKDYCARHGYCWRRGCRAAAYPQVRTCFRMTASELSM